MIHQNRHAGSNEHNRLDWRIDGKPIQLLSPAEETAIVHQLCLLRAEIDRRIRPIVERKLAKDERIEHFDQLMSAYHRIPKVPRSIERPLQKKFAAYTELKHRLVVCNLPWLTKLTRLHRSSTVSDEDLFQEGVCGLLKAIDRFQSVRGLRLMTYGTWYIREAMQQVRARQSHLVSLSAHDQTLYGQIETIKSKFVQAHGRYPSASELGEICDRDAAFISKLQAATNTGISLDAPEAGPIPIPIDDPIAEFERIESAKGTVSKLMAGLSKRERIVVTRRFGLDGSEPTSLEDLGAVLRLSKERVRQVQRQAIRRMQQLANDTDPFAMTSSA